MSVDGTLVSSLCVHRPMPQSGWGRQRGSSGGRGPQGGPGRYRGERHRRGRRLHRATPTVRCCPAVASHSVHTRAVGAGKATQAVDPSHEQRRRRGPAHFLLTIPRSTILRAMERVASLRSEYRSPRSFCALLLSSWGHHLECDASIRSLGTPISGPASRITARGATRLGIQYLLNSGSSIRNHSCWGDGPVGEEARSRFPRAPYRTHHSVHVAVADDVAALGGRIDHRQHMRRRNILQHAHREEERRPHRPGETVRALALACTDRGPEERIQSRTKSPP